MLTRASVFLSIHQELEESEERCDLAEQTLAKFRARGRGASAIRGASPVSILYLHQRVGVT